MLRMVRVGEDVFGSGGVLPGKVPETKNRGKGYFHSKEHEFQFNQTLLGILEALSYILDIVIQAVFHVTPSEHSVSYNELQTPT